jgi:hypothetical protein
MNFVRRAGIMIAAAAVSIGLLGIAAPAQADTSWGCGGYCRTLPGGK